MNTEKFFEKLIKGWSLVTKLALQIREYLFEPKPQLELPGIRSSKREKERIKKFVGKHRSYLVRILAGLFLITAVAPLVQYHHLSQRTEGIILSVMFGILIVCAAGSGAWLAFRKKSSKLTSAQSDSFERKQRLGKFLLWASVVVAILLLLFPLLGSLWSQANRIPKEYVIFGGVGIVALVIALVFAVKKFTKSSAATPTPELGKGKETLNIFAYIAAAVIFVGTLIWLYAKGYGVNPLTSVSFITLMLLAVVVPLAGVIVAMKKGGVRWLCYCAVAFVIFMAFIDIRSVAIRRDVVIRAQVAVIPRTERTWILKIQAFNRQTGQPLPWNNFNDYPAVIERWDKEIIHFVASIKNEGEAPGTCEFIWKLTEDKFYGTWNQDNPPRNGTWDMQRVGENLYWGNIYAGPNKVRMILEANGFALRP